ncbi:MAG TPA: HDOD domain-containing protein [Janthinobacterium sp.]|nr:HDOD domain-containing protein [Janthinobacterium sp.]
MQNITTAQEIVRQVRDLPSLPAVVAELLACSAQEDFDLQALADKISLDQALAAKTLRLANSSFYGMQSQVTNMRQAIAVLGLRSVRMLVAACAVTGSFAPVPGSSFDFQLFWRHSVGTAVVARALAPHLGLDPESAFIAGLLHDLGCLVLATGQAQANEAVLAYRAEHDCQLVEAEQAVLGFDHAQVGSALVAHWKFPAEIQAAVAAHHDASSCIKRALPLLVHTANIMAHALDLSGAEDDLVPPLSELAWAALNLSDPTCLQVFRETDSAFQDMCTILLG